MSLYAFQDESRLQDGKVYAADLEKKGTPWEKNADYYCPSPNCTACMRYRKGSERQSAHFYALGKQHSESCSYNHLEPYNPSDYAEAQFDFQHAMEVLQGEARSQEDAQPGQNNSCTQKTSQPIKPLTKLKEIHRMLKNHDCREQIGKDHRTVGDMLLDNRNISGFRAEHLNCRYKIVEAMVSDPPVHQARPRLSDSLKEFVNTLSLQEKVAYLPVLHLHLKSDQKELLLDVYFEDLSLFWEIIPRIWGGKGRRKPKNQFVVVAARWYQSTEKAECYETVIKSKKQIIYFQ